MVTTDIVFRAVAHPTRRKILSLLSTDARSVKELTSEFNISQPAISQHLSELRAAHLVCADRVGLEQRYRLTAAPLKSIYDWSLQYRRLFDPGGHSWAFVSLETPQEKLVKKGGRKHGR